MSLADELARITRRKLLSQITTTDRLVRMQYIRAANDIAKEIRTAKPKQNIVQRIEAEKSPEIRNILKADLGFLCDIRSTLRIRNNRLCPYRAVPRR